MRIFDWPINESDLKNCNELIKAGEVGGITTDTVFGLVFDSNSKRACKKVSDIKKRENDIFTFHIGDLSQIENSDVIFADHVLAFMKDNLPGSLTVIADGEENGIKKSFGIRMPENPASRKFFSCFSFPSVVATSTNETGSVPLVVKKDVLSFLKNRISFCIFEKSQDAKKKASTIIRIIDKKIEILREGSLKITDLNKTALS